ncbi:MAG: hypothetical protein ACPGLY_05645 [Rubripirellula sp.]
MVVKCNIRMANWQAGWKLLQAVLVLKPQSCSGNANNDVGKFDHSSESGVGLNCCFFLMNGTALFAANHQKFGDFKTRKTPSEFVGLPRWLILVGLLVANLHFVSAFEVGERVRIRDGADYRMGTVLGTLGDAYRVGFDDGRQPAESLLDERQFVSDSEFKAETARRERSERTSRFFQALGAAIGKGSVVAVIIVVGIKLRKRYQANESRASHGGAKE